MKRVTKTPETTVKDQVVEYLTKSGIFFRRMQSGKVRVRRGFVMLGPEGTADFLICLPNRMPHWIELKAPKAKTSPERQDAQAAFSWQVRNLGHRYTICESLEEVIAFLRMP